MKILAIEPYYGGSHRAFLEGWSSVSRHDWTIVELPPHKWKWRMRHGAVTLADRVSKLVKAGSRWDILFCSDMLNLAEFRGLVEPTVAELPSVVYFHENQLTYPVREEAERDLHFAFTNMTTALAAREVWFNSAFHRDSFLDALANLLERMPDYNEADKVEVIRSRSKVRPQGVAPLPRRGKRPPGLPHILWVARWEHDKNPELFFDSLRRLVESRVDFKVSVLGESFADSPEVFKTAPDWLGDRIANWGFRQSRDEYLEILGQADIVVSTADHEFFGVAVVEAVAAGAYPLLPDRLAYPEIFSEIRDGGAEEFFYDGTLDSLEDSLLTLIEKVRRGELWAGVFWRASHALEEYFWPNLGPRLDDALSAVVR